jgi:hypothetical protein
MLLADDQNMIQALTPKASDQAFSVWVLARRPRSYVRFGMADITRSPSNVRFTPESGQSADMPACLLSAKSDSCSAAKGRLIRSPRRRGRAASVARQGPAPLYDALSGWAGTEK